MVSLLHDEIIDDKKFLPLHSEKSKKNRVRSGVTPAPSHTTIHAVRHTTVRERLSEDISPHRLSVLSTALDV